MKSELRRRDPYHPKPNLSGYNFFAEQDARLKQIHSRKDREISKIIGDVWNKPTETEKAAYQERAVKDKERYQSEMEVCVQGEIKGSSQVAIPIQQRFAVPVTFSIFHPAAETESILNENMENGSTSEESDSDEEKSAEKSMDMDASPEADSKTDSGNQAQEPSVEGDGFELRIRDEDGAKMKADGCSS